MSKTLALLVTIFSGIGVSAANPARAQGAIGVDFGGSAGPLQDVSVSGLGIPGLPVQFGGNGKREIQPPEIGGPRPSSSAGAIDGVPGSLDPAAIDAWMNSSGSRGSGANDSGLTARQAVAVATGTAGGVNLERAQTNLMAPNSVDRAPYASGRFNYGFPRERTAPYLGVSRGSVGGFLPATSTASVDFNTVDCPLRGPLGGGTPNIGYAPIDIAIPLGNGIIVSGSLSTDQILGQLQNWISAP